jgi:hypothetical protein
MKTCSKAAAIIMLAILVVACGRRSEMSASTLDQPTAKQTTPVRPSVRSEATTQPAPPATTTKATESAVSEPQIRSQNGLIYSELEVEHHSVDLVQFVDATAQELSRDSRVRLVRSGIDTELMTTTIPIGVIEYEAVSVDSPEPNATNSTQTQNQKYVGRLYILMRPQESTATVISCLAMDPGTERCDQLVRDTATHDGQR